MSTAARYAATFSAIILLFAGLFLVCAAAGAFSGSVASFVMVIVWASAATVWGLELLLKGLKP